MEKNSENLSRAIARLTEYQPPDLLWQNLEEQLDTEQNLDSLLREMPTYAPSAALWEQLALRIEKDPELSPKPRIHTRFKWSIVALLLALAISIGFWSLKPTSDVPTEKQAPTTPVLPKPNDAIAQMVPDNKQPAPPTKKIKKLIYALSPPPRITLRKEVVDDRLIMAGRQTDDPNYEIIEKLCLEALPVCEEPKFKQLKAEFDKLSTAHDDLKNALGNFADDPNLVAQLIEIEHARIQILQQLVTMI